MAGVQLDAVFQSVPEVPAQVTKEVTVTVMVLEYTASLTNGDISDLPVGFEIELLLGDQLLDLYKYLPVVFLVKGIEL